MDDILDAFEEAWSSGASVPDIARFLPEPGDDSRDETLRELIKIDLEYQWRASSSNSDSKPPTLDAYFAEFPELGPSGDCPIPLIAHEYRIRTLYGDCPSAEEYYCRFPGSAGGLSDVLKAADASMIVVPRDDTRSGWSARNDRAAADDRAKPSDSPEEFLRCVTENGLVSETRAIALIETLAQQPKAADTLARAFVREGLLTAYQAQAVYKGKGRSLALGNYIILDKLGQGSLGAVFKARHRKMKRTVVLKVLAPGVNRTPEASARFQRQVRVASGLDHPNFVTALDAGEARNMHFLALQFVEGVDLATRVRNEGPLSITQAIDCIRQAAVGFQYAHERGLVHRNIKPSNLLLDTTGAVKILDMGLARMDNTDGTQAVLTSTGTVMGSVDYMSPEQAMSIKNADARSDIYSLGISLWFLLTGQPAYPGKSMMARLLAHREAEIPSLTAVRSDVPPELAALFERMVAKAPQERPQSMADVVAGLEAIPGYSDS